MDSLNSVGGILYIQNNPLLTNLSGLDQLDSISGSLYIQNNSSLTELTSLDRLNSIGGDLSINSNHIENLEGLGSLKIIGGTIFITGGGGYEEHLISLDGLDSLSTIGGSLHISYTQHLTSLSGISKLSSVGGGLYFFGNQNLTSLTGLDSIDAGTITNIRINYNNSLSTCAVKSICDYLAAPNGEIYIGNNATGCNSQAEVQAACAAVTVDNLTGYNAFSIYPNPTSNQLTIESFTRGQLSILDFNGQQVIIRQITEFKTQLDISNLPSGIYFAKLMCERVVHVEKILKK